MFNDTIQKLALDEKTRIAHQDGSDGGKIISVEIEFDNHQKLIPINSNTITLKRELNTENGKDSYFLDNKLIVKSDLHSFFGFTGILFTDMCRTIHQGKIQEVANLDEQGLLELLLDYSGATQLKERLESLRSSLSICGGKKDEIEKFKDTVHSKLELIAEKVSDFKILQRLSTEKYSLEYLKLKKAGENLGEDVIRNEEERKYLLEKIMDEKVSKNEIFSEFQMYTVKIKELESKIKANQEKEKMYKNFIEANKYEEFRVLDGENKVQEYKDAYAGNIEDKHKSTEELEAQLSNILKAKEEYLQKVKEQTEEFSKIQEKYLKEKENFELMTEDLHHNSLKRIGFKSKGQRKEYYDQEINKAVIEISGLQRHLEIEKRTQGKIEEEIQKLNPKILEIKNDIEDKKKQISQLKENMDPSKKILDNRNYIQNLNFILSEKKIEKDESDREMKVIEGLIELSDKGFKTVKRLVKKIEEADISGFQGLFIDLIEIDTHKVNTIIDVILKNKLFVFVVDTVSCARKIMDLNKEFKGGVIQCFPLELIDQVSQTLPSLPPIQNTSPLIKHLSIKKGVDSRVQTLMESFLGKVYLVRDLKTAFALSEQYKITSITPAFQVVRPGAFIAKTGNFGNKVKRIEHYNDLLVLKKKEKLLQQAIFEIETNVANHRLKDLDYMKTIQEYLLASKGLTQSIQNQNLELMEKSSKLTDHMNNLEKTQSHIQNIENQIQVQHNRIDHLKAEMKDKNGSDSSIQGDSKELLEELENQKKTVISHRMKMNQIGSVLDADKMHLNTILLKREQEVEQTLQEKEKEENLEKEKSESNSRHNEDLVNMEEYDARQFQKAREDLQKVLSNITHYEEALDRTNQQLIQKSQEKRD